MKCLRHIDSGIALTPLIHGYMVLLSHSLPLTVWPWLQTFIHFYLFMRDQMCSEAVAHHWSVFADSDCFKLLTCPEGFWISCLVITMATILLGLRWCIFIERKFFKLISPEIFGPLTVWHKQFDLWGKKGLHYT